MSILVNIGEDPYVGKIFPSLKYGYFKVVELLGVINRKTRYKVKFLDSGGENITIAFHIRKGDIGDPRCGINTDIIQYSNHCGGFKILEILNGAGHRSAPKAKIQFINTGTIKVVDLQHIRYGTILDPCSQYKIPINTNVLQPNIKILRIHNALSNRYDSMIKRCYDPNDKHYSSYGGIGVSVCDRWRSSFYNFEQDCTMLYGYDKFCTYPTLYNVDKDYLQQNIPNEKRIYSPETCMFLHMNDNVNLQHLEYARNHGRINKYFGVISFKNKSIVQFMINTEIIKFGAFEDEYFAAQAYNTIYKWYHPYELVPLLNDVPDADPLDISKYNLEPRVIKIIDIDDD